MAADAKTPAAPVAKAPAKPEPRVAKPSDTQSARYDFRSRRNLRRGKD